tara:strand:+ start:767 stop:964 length:198 start_codon:yes stop_codon:yes gene_type:complete
MWILILILLSGSGQVGAFLVGAGPDMYDCFRERDALLIEAGAYEGHFPPGMQALCLQLPVKGVSL